MTGSDSLLTSIFPGASFLLRLIDASLMQFPRCPFEFDRFNFETNVGYQEVMVISDIGFASVTYVQKRSTPYSADRNVINLILCDIFGWYTRELVDSFLGEESAADYKILISTKTREQFSVLSNLSDSLTLICLNLYGTNLFSCKGEQRY